MVLQTLPVDAELRQTILIDVLDTAALVSHPSYIHRLDFRELVHASGTSCDLATFLHALQLAPAVRLGLAHHVVIVEGLAPCADEEGGAEKRRRASSDLLDLGDVVGKRGGVDEGLLVESAPN